MRTLHKTSGIIFILEFLFSYSCSPPHIYGYADDDDVLEPINDYLTKEPPLVKDFVMLEKDIREDLAEKTNTAVGNRLSQIFKS